MKKLLTKPFPPHPIVLAKFTDVAIVCTDNPVHRLTFFTYREPRALGVASVESLRYEPNSKEEHIGRPCSDIYRSPHADKTRANNYCLEQIDTIAKRTSCTRFGRTEDLGASG